MKFSKKKIIPRRYERERSRSRSYSREYDRYSVNFHFNYKLFNSIGEGEELIAMIVTQVQIQVMTDVPDQGGILNLFVK